jgi:CRP-like cAMP-binding protein
MGVKSLQIACKGAGETLTESVLELLKEIDILAELDERTLELLESRAERHLLSQGDTLYRQGDISVPLALVLGGCIRLERDLDSNHTALLDLRGEGMVVDELSPFSGKPASCTAVAIETTEVLALSGNELAALIRKNAIVAEGLVKSLAAFLHEETETGGEMLPLDAAARLARHILRSPRKDATHVHLAHSQEELAHRIGTRRETVNRCMQQFRRDAVIRQSGRFTYEMNVPELYRLAGYSVISRE